MTLLRSFRAIARAYRRFAYCRWAAHQREALDLRAWPMKPWTPDMPAHTRGLVIHTLEYRCLDCGASTFLVHSDNLGSNRRGDAGKARA